MADTERVSAPTAMSKVKSIRNRSDAFLQLLTESFDDSARLLKRVLVNPLVIICHVG
jgi:hypothetical protein